MPLADSTLLATPSRLAALATTGLLDALPLSAFDRLTRLATRLVGAPMAMVSLVDDRRQFFLSQVGLAEPWATARESALTHSFCQHVVAGNEPLVVSDAPSHPLVHDNLAISGFGVIAYAGMPLRAPDGQVLGSFCALDTRPRLWTPDELQTLEDLAAAAMTEVGLRIAVRDLQRMAKVKDDLIAIVSHELRTPLTGILGALRLESAQRKPGGDSRMLDIALRGAERLQRLTNDLLSIEQIEHGGTELHYEEVDVSELLATAARDVQAFAAESGVRVEVHEARGRLSADLDRMMQVLSNLLNNAIKFSPPGSVVSMSGTPRDGSVALVVRDSGRGIPADKLEAIFERFTQVEAGDQSQKGGAGLGLAICRAIVSRHRGRIWAESVLGHGSSFHVALPAR